MIYRNKGPPVDMKLKFQINWLNYIRFWQANGESQKTSMRVKTRLHQLVEDGIYTGGCAPFGYRNFRPLRLTL